MLHIRNGKELPWISYDNNYNFNFQQIRNLREERTILPGDMLINRCVYSNTDREGNVTVGGFSSRMEMCNGFLWYYNKLPNQGICRSEIRSDTYREFLNIWNTTWSNQRIEMIVTDPVENQGLAVSDVGTFRTDWNIEKRNRLQYLHRYLPQITQCPPLLAENTDRQSSIQVTGDIYDFLKRRNWAEKFVVRSGGETRGLEKEIQEPEYEFVSVYSRDTVPYEPTSVCRTKTG